MDKNAIKKYAVWARRELISRVSQKALQYGITEKNMVDAGADSVNGHLLTSVEKKQRQALIAKIKKENYGQVMEEVAYTWFNRFIALRFMEVNGYLPTHVRVFTDANNAFKPQILTEAIHLEMDGLDMDKVYALKTANQTDELFKYLIITQCNAMSSILPGMFQKIEDYTELLFPDNLLREGSVIEQMIAMIPEEDWKDEVQIIGWLYQYYNTEPKQAVFDGLKKNIKITKENIPAATQLFTPDWIVRYMVENSLGRLWLESHPNDVLKANWKYYLEEAKQEPEVQAQLEKIREEYKALRPEDIKFIDPCMGSGHILVYAFDVLMQIYESEGYNPRDAAKLILEKNLYGLDIDKRAYQLAYFALMMKARQCNRRIFTEAVKPQVYHPAGFPDGEEYGSLVKVDKLPPMPARFLSDGETYNPYYDDELRIWNFKRLLAQKYDVVVTNPPYMGSSNMNAKLSDFVKKNYPDSKSDLFSCFIERGLKMIKQNGFNCMVTMQSWMFLSSFETMRKKILSTRTIANLMHMENMVMGIAFGTAVANLRGQHIDGYKGQYNHVTMSDIVGNAPLMFPPASKRNCTATADNFAKVPGCPVAYWVGEKFIDLLSQEKTIGNSFESGSGLSTADNDRFLRFFWEVSRERIANSKSDKNKWYLFHKGGEYRKWYGNLFYVVNWENDGEEIKYWVTHNPSDPNTTSWSRRIFNTHLYFKKGVTWSVISSGKISFRVIDENAMISNAAGGVFGFTNDSERAAFLAAVNTNIWGLMFSTINPTLNYSSGVIQKAPAPCSIDSTLSEECISLSRADWDSFETSWDFKRHPLVHGVHDKINRFKKNILVHEMLEGAYQDWKREAAERFKTLKTNEEELNRIFIDIYGLQDELTPEEDDKDVTVHYIADTKEDAPEGMRNSPYLLTKQDVIKSLISYAVGCMFGRYSLDKEGLIFAGGNFDEVYWKFLGQAPCDKDGSLPYGSGYAGISLAKYHYPYFRDSDDISTATKLTYSPDVDNCIPICDDDYFEDDILGRFVKFVEVVYGEETLEENLKFIADALGGKGSPREVIRNYFINDFYADHCKTYKKRPIYWLFDSGKKNGFKALIYMHRYQPDTLARMRTDYVHEQQARYRTALADVEQRMTGASGSERVKLNKQLAKLEDQATEIREYEEKIHHLADQMISIDLDDGVKHNYAIFKDVLAPIK